ncbi:MAG TPA: toll/interleukin-1 receptor domain-containing protein [Chthoniobacterales bacterium]|nr:toll/interleukin-1 receptor domain-containing protein [Chthoniobacterales bacterium]
MTPAEQGQFRSPRIFISYSQHDPAQHSRRVREFAQALADDGLDVELDQYHQNEPVDWPRWCEERLRKENSDFVLMICSAEYKNRIENRVPADKGRGVFWEGSIIDDYLYEAKANERFIPILLDNESEESLPRIVRGWTWFKVSGFGIASGEVGYTNLYRLLTTQPGVVKPMLGERKVLSPDLPSRPPSSESAAKPTNLPYPSLGPLFKGREDFLNGIRAGFAGDLGRAQAISARQAVHGLGGIGKTRAAVEYAWRFATEYTALLFVSAETPLDFRANIAALGPILKIAEGVTDDTLRFTATIDWLRDPRHRGWLLIVDNLDTPEAAEEAGKNIATLESGHVLITGRLSEWPAFVESRPLDVLDPDAATEFLLARTADKRQPHDNDAAEARSLAGELGGLALALEQAAAFIRRHALSFSDYFQRWRAADQRVRLWHDARTMQYERPLAATWQTTIDLLSDSARSLLHLLAWMAPEPFPRLLFDYDSAPTNLRHLFRSREAPRKILRALSEDTEAEPEEAFAMLRDFSLLLPAKEVEFANEGYLHRVVSLIARERQTVEEQSISLRGALELLDAGTVGDPGDVRFWPLLDVVRPHLRALVGFADEHGIAEPTARLMNTLAMLLTAKAQHAEAEPLFRRALSINEKTFGPEHPDVARDLNNLAYLLQATSRPAEAEPLMSRVVEIKEKAFGPNDPQVATALNNLAAFLQNSNRHGEAEPLCRRALEIREKAFGSEDASVGVTLNNLGQLFRATNRLEEAESCMSRSIAIFEKVFGSEHPKVGTAVNNLALLLQVTNRLEEAEALFRRALSIDEKSLGAEHPDVAIDLNNLAKLLEATGRFAEAEPLMRRHLVIFLKVTRNSGHLHPHMQAACRNYISLLDEMSFSVEQMQKHLASVGSDAGFHEEGFRQLLSRLLAD